MIVTKSWLNEFIDLSGVSDETLYATFNAIGLEVDSMEKVEIAEKVVIGKVVSCEKHPDADKLNVCKIDVGTGIRQIVCGAANVVDAEYVAVATIGAVLPGNFEIKHAKLRGVESEGMVCAASELGLPDMGKGIMILDESIGELEVGRELNMYEKVADTIIELELTANRGDCLSIYGVARDLSAALNIEMKPFEYKQEERMKLGIARKVELHTKGEIDVDLRYKLADIHVSESNFLIKLRLTMVKVEAGCPLEEILSYTTHTTGVVLRMYDCVSFCEPEEEKAVISVDGREKGIVDVHLNGKHVSIVGVNQVDDTKPTVNSKEVLIEASYIHPDLLSEAVANKEIEKDDLYYKTSRGSNPDLSFGLSYLAFMIENNTEMNCYEGSLNVEVEREKERVLVDVDEISAIVGMEIELSKIATVLKKLDFEITVMSDRQLATSVPLFRHDIKNIQDIAEEIVRIIGINNIPAKPLFFAEKMRLNKTSHRYQAKKRIRNRAVGVGFYENISYVFSEKAVLEKYGFVTMEDALELANPIAEELNTLRSTLLVNLLLAVKRNVSYTKKSIPLFEIGAVFDAKRNQSERVGVVFAGQAEPESVKNAGKPPLIDFAIFTQKLGSVIGHFDLVPCTHKNGLIHPYQSADIVIDGKICGFISKLHPTVQEAYDIPVTFIAEVDFDVLMPKHINAKPISKFQGVYKDFSIVIDKSINYYEVAKVLNELDLPMLKESYPVDIYTDDKLGDKKSLTIRFFIQSMEKTLEESDIENVMKKIMEALESECGAELR
jgi:phenylalanyl-tRNA synthetase beta chain